MRKEHEELKKRNITVSHHETRSRLPGLVGTTEVRGRRVVQRGNVVKKGVSKRGEISPPPKTPTHSTPLTLPIICTQPLSPFLSYALNPSHPSYHMHSVIDRYLRWRDEKVLLHKVHVQIKTRTGEHGVLKWVSTEYLIWMSTEYLRWMSTEYLAWVSTEYLAWVSTEYLAWVSTEYLGWVSTKYLAWVSTECLRRVSTES
jgi:hypothetical protein